MNASTSTSVFSLSAMRSRRSLKILGITLALLFVMFLIAFQVAIHFVKQEIAAFLGPLGEIKELNVGLTGVEIVGIRLPASDVPGWPAENLLQADRIVVTPSLGALFGGHIALSSIHVEGGYISMLRTRNGKIEILPTLLSPAHATARIRAKSRAKTEAETNTADDAMPEVTIDHITLKNSVLDFFDASVRRTPVEIRMEQIDLRLDHLHFPDLKGKSQITLQALVKGKESIKAKGRSEQAGGQIKIDGWMELASKDSDLRLKLQGVDLIPLQPYLIQAADTGVRRGSLNLDLHSKVQKGVLHAPGTLVLNNLELSDAGRSFMGVPRSLAVSMMKNKKGQISIQFALDGNINDPHFSLNENIAGKIGVAFAKSLGVGFGNLAESVGKNLSGGVNAIGDLLKH